MMRLIILALLLVIPHFSYASLLDGLQGYWDLNETSGSRASQVNGFTLTDNNTVTSTTTGGRIGTAAYFTSANSESLSLTDTSNFEGMTAFTINMWVRPTSQSLNASREPMLFSKWQHSTQNQYMWLLSGTSDIALYVGHSACSGFNYTNVTKKHYMTANNLYMLTVVFDGGTVTQYTNASSTGSGTVTATSILNCTANLRLGARDSAGAVDYYDGTMDEVGFWNRALSTAEVNLLYGNGSGFEYPMATTTPGTSISGSGIIGGGTVIR